MNSLSIINNERYCIITKLKCTFIHSDLLYVHLPASLWSVQTSKSLHYWTGTTALDILLAWQPVRTEMTSHMTQPRLSTDKAREHNHFFPQGERLHNRQHCIKNKGWGVGGAMTRCSVPIIPWTSSRCNILLCCTHRAEVGVYIYSSPAHRDPTSVTEPHTNGALQLLEVKVRWDEEQKRNE